MTAPHPLTSLDIALHTLEGSSIWTGNADKQMTYLKATSFLGGLRFWTEALLRAQGHKVCTAQSRCLHSPEKEANTCAACQIFGCTGLGRSFALKVLEGQNTAQKTYSKDDLSVGVVHKHTKKLSRYIFPKAYTGPLRLRLVAQRPDTSSGTIELSRHLVQATLLMLEYGALGAYDQYGCGLVYFTSDAVSQIPPHYFQMSPAMTETVPREFSSLQDFFFFKGKYIPAKNTLYDFENFKNNGRTGLPPEALKLAPVALLRTCIRAKIRETISEKAIRHNFCGFLNQGPVKNGEQKEEPSGSKYSLGITPDGQVYGWGFYPSHNVDKRNAVLACVSAVLHEYCADITWKEFNSVRSTDTALPAVWDNYLHHMLTTPWKERA